MKMRYQNEKAFYDKMGEKALSLSDEKFNSRKGWLRDNEIFIDEIGDVRGKKVLDCGCGDGLIACYLAAKGGGIVWAFDISGNMIETAERRARLLKIGDKIHFQCCSFEEADYSEECFDIIYGNMILHHLENPELVIQKIERMLRSDGKAVFRETSAINPALMLIRKKIVGRFSIQRRSTPDEYPLTKDVLDKFKLIFDDMRVYYPEMFFWRLVSRFFSMPLMRSMPQDSIYHGCAFLDRITYYLFPFFRKFSYYCYIRFTKNQQEEES